MSARDFHFTSESVTEGHPDKMADQISDAVLDAVLAQDQLGRVACETFVTTGLVVVAGEITTKAHVDIPRLVRARSPRSATRARNTASTRNTCSVIVAVDEQSPDIAQGVDSRTRRSTAGDDDRWTGSRRRRPGHDVRLCVPTRRTS